MSSNFGGYKFKGKCLEYDSLRTGETRLEDLHKTRVKAFLDANAEHLTPPWILDSDRVGDADFDGNIGAIHTIKDSSNNKVGFASFFKYRDTSKPGYYLIFTSSWSTYTSNTQYPRLLDYQLMYSKTGNSSNYEYIFSKSSVCLHAISVTQFGDLPSPGSPSVDFIPVGSSRLVSVGQNNAMNTFNDVSLNESAVSSGFCESSYDVCFGYAIKDTDIIAFSAPNKQSLVDKINVSILSIDAFSQYSCPNDSYGLLLFMPFSLNGSDSEADYSSAFGISEYGQFLTEEGNCLCMNKAFKLANPNENSNYFRVKAGISCDISSFYYSTAASSIPLKGVNLYLESTSSSYSMASGQVSKGTTRPELMCNNITSVSSSLDTYDTFLDGNLLFVHKNRMVAGTSGSSTYMYYAPICLHGGSVSTYYTSSLDQYHYPWYSAYHNLYVGWDSSNPSLIDPTSWETFDPTA